MQRITAMGCWAAFLGATKHIEGREAPSQIACAIDDIGSVLDVIPAIALQTNLLALNAVIEAAYTGDSGR